MPKSLRDFTEPGDKEILIAPRNKTTKRIFIAATRMNDGKTTTTLGLFSALRSKTERVGFIKPIGQRFVEIDGYNIDEDSVLLDQVFDVKTPIQAMSPITIHPNLTRDYLDKPEAHQGILIDKICRAFDRAAFEQDYIITEGTGHAGVGAVFNLSNADVAKCFNAKVIIVASGGIGRPIDEIAINKAVFEAAGVQIIGAIINKVEPDKLDMIKKYCGIALSNMKIPLLGCIPLERKLTQPNLEQVVKETKGRWVNAEASGRNNRINKVIIGAMAAKGLVEHLDAGLLIITPGDREDIILAVIAIASLDDQKDIAGIILTRSLLPDSKLIQMLAQTKIPVVLCAEDSYEVASKVNKMTVKTQPEDQDKIPIIKDLITKNIDLSAILSAFDSQD
ncbi:MAG: AAA family ATPase [Verrucomicrobiota bacterium]|nr:AAA family ATPase [Verrucomicrobiota bacterium]